ncbi:putative membrane protein [Beijerinckia sp. GAS462]|nr:putative membrane protein [Beijerinckia sp. GAS462]SEC48936.1 Uncharacterized membrane protein [Beijerinckia sp. 28-YEA-48]
MLPALEPELMDDSFFVFLALAGLVLVVLGPVTFFLTLGARGRVSELEQTVRRLEYRLRRVEEAPPEGRTAPAEAAPAAPVQPIETFAPAERASEPMEALASEAAVPPDAPTEAAAAAPAPARPSRSLEESFGTRWTVWVGGLALALGALLLVRYSIEAGLFGPAARVAFGLILAAALIVGGEVLRRREPPVDTVPVAAMAKPSIPAMLTAAGTVAAFGAIYAAHALYGFIGPAPAFIALGVVGVACMFASALHGPSLAGLGLVGAFVAPLLVDSDAPNPWPVVLYLAVLTAVAYGLARLRLWLWLAIAAAVGAALWGLVFASQIEGGDAGQFFPATMIHIIIQMALAGYFLAWDPSRTTSEEDARPDPIAIAAPLIFGLLAIGALLEGSLAGQFGNGWVLFSALAIAALALIGFLVAPAAAVFAAAGVLALVTARLWPATITPDARGTLPDFAADFFIGPVQPNLFIGFCTVAALAMLALGGWRMLIARRLPVVTLSIYSATAALTPLAVLIVAWMRMAQGERSFAFAASAAALALIFVGAATKFRDLESRGADETPNARFATGVFASAAIAALALGFTFALNGGALVVALAVAALGAAYVGVKLEIPALRWCVAGLGVIIAARLAWEPRVIAQPGTTPIFNWLLYGYGVPALAFGYAARLMRRHGGEDTPVRVAQALTILFAAFLVFFEIRHLINAGDPFAAAAPTIEQGLHAVAAFSFAIVLTKLDAARSSIVFRIASLGFGVLSFAYAIIGLGGFGNPYFSWQPVEGGTIFNALLIAYLLPAILAFVLSLVANGVRPAWYVTMARVVAILLVFGYLTLETRRLFQGPYLGLLRHTSGAEFYAYSAVWLAFGVVLLAWGLLRGSREARLASAVFVAISVLKVFLFDLAGLEGILRALSFIGLGAVLIGIGLVYQKLVFVRPASTPENAPTDRPPGAAP